MVSSFTTPPSNRMDIGYVVAVSFVLICLIVCHNKSDGPLQHREMMHHPSCEEYSI